ncbi:hypothetical protein RN001_009923 [Aquatica leii]|uniref:Fibronectin type-III domain-containing protein n=1 Tax=Aquatica leii TaxID=1421715 RepID=A0AAN7PVV3_9COLE|nr:hypothetical protein RN001_009923 [Aquatica leii]
MYVVLLVLLFKICVNAQLIPNSVTSVKTYQMSPQVMFLKWDRPNSQYILTHYDIQFSDIQNGYVDTEDYLCSVDGNETQVRLPPLPAYQSYRIYIYSIFTAIASKATIVDIALKGVGNYLPSKPDFVYEVDKSKGAVRVIWTPVSDLPGDCFYVHYKKTSDSDYINTNIICDKFDVVIDNLVGNEVYLFFIVASYGNAKTESNIKEINT